MKLGSRSLKGGREYYERKSIHLSIRVDYYTYQAIEEIMKLIGKNSISEVVRMSIWYMLILTNPKLTVRKAFKEEAIERIVKGEDINLIDAFKKFSELMEEVVRQ